MKGTQVVVLVWCAASQLPEHRDCILNVELKDGRQVS